MVQISKRSIDTGGMFPAEVGIQKINDNRYRAYVTNGWGGGIQCFRSTKEKAEEELPRLFKKLYGTDL